MDTGVSVESIIKMVTQEVLRELARQGRVPAFGSAPAPGFAPAPVSGVFDEAANGRKAERIEMGGYRTPLVSDRAIRRLHELTGAIVVPKGAILTPMAKETIRQKNIEVIYE